MVVLDDTGPAAEFPARRSRPPLDHPAPEEGVVWVAAVSYADDGDDTMFSPLLIGVFTSRRRAFRGLIRYLIDDDGKPLRALHRLTWEVHPGLVEAWDDERWDEPDTPRFSFDRERLDDDSG